MKLLTKKGQAQNALSGVPGLVLTMGLIVIVLGVTAQIGGQTRDTMTADSIEYNITNTSLFALEDLADWMPVIAVIIGAAIVITILLSSFGQRL